MNIFLKSGLLAGLLATGAYASVASPAPARPKTIHIDIHNFAFVPARVEAQVGDVIEWTNKDFAPHTATDAGGKWTTPTLARDATARIIVRTAGTIAYACKFHPQMKASIVVTGTAAKSTKAGKPS
jgi:plastocyanin